MTLETEIPVSEETKEYIRKWLISETNYEYAKLICCTSEEETSETDETSETSETNETAESSEKDE